MISCLVVNDVMESTSSAEQTGVAYIYFDYADKDAETADAVVSSLTKQLLLQGNKPEMLTEIHKTCKARNSRPTLNELLEVLQAGCSHFSRVFFILDALDECEEKERQATLKALGFLNPEKYRVFATSRPVVTSLGRQFDECEKIEIKAQPSDIRLLAKDKIESDGGFSDLIGDDQDLEFTIITAIIKRSNDM
jgi:hypothetical protein